MQDDNVFRALADPSRPLFEGCGDLQFGRDDRVRVQAVTPQRRWRRGEQLTAFQSDMHWLARPTARRARPFIEAVGRDQTALADGSVLKHRAFEQRLSAPTR